MIKHIFLPEHISGYYLLPQKVLGLSIDQDGIRACKVKVQGSGIQIEEFLFEQLGFSPEEKYEESVKIALQNIIKKCGSYQQIRVAPPRDKVVFKELTFPFVEPNKVSMVLGFELEPLIPFPLDQAVYDFVVTQKDVENKQLTVMAAVVQRKDITNLLTLFTEAGIAPQSVVIDSLSLYSFMQQNPAYSASTDNQVLINLGSHETSILAVNGTQLSQVRTINSGLLKLGSHADVERALRYESEKDSDDVDNTDGHKDILVKINEFFNKIAFTLTSFQAQGASKISKIILTGEAASLNHLCEFSKHKLGIDCELFDVKQLTSHKNLSVKKKNVIEQANVPVAAIACPTTKMLGFNLLNSFFKTSNKTVVTSQLIASIVLVTLIFGSFFTYYYMKYSSLAGEIKKSSTELNRTMKNTFDIQKSSSPAALVANAKRKIAEEEALWFSFSKQTRFSFLEYLQELSVRIDRQSLGIQFKKLSMNDEKITLEGQVSGHGFKSLLLLEESLKESPLLQTATIPEELEKYDRKSNTTSFIVNITIPKEGRE